MKTFIATTVIVLGFNVCQACWKPAEDVVSPLAPKDTFTCNERTSKAQLKGFLSQLSHYRHSSACAEHWWLGNLAEVKLKGKQHRTAIADVGCNKAYFSATALNYLAPEYGNHLQLFFQHHANRPMYAKPCGGCNECRQTPPVNPAGGQAQVDVFCFEPSEIHVASLTAARDALYGPPDGTSKAAAAEQRTQPTRVNFHIAQAAVSDKPGVAHFPVNCTGNTCSLGAKNQTFQAVNVTTVDEHMRTRGLSYLDVLKIDTEGFDPAVLAGAYNSLKGRRIGLVSFEYHSLWKRSGGSLRLCSRYLDDLGYACFYDGPKLAKLSGGCWRDGYELRRWTNVVCVVRGSDMEAELNAGSYLALALAQEEKKEGGKSGGRGDK